jgi:hypothetical protein
MYKMSMVVMRGMDVSDRRLLEAEVADGRTEWKGQVNTSTRNANIYVQSEIAGVVVNVVGGRKENGVCGRDGREGEERVGARMEGGAGIYKKVRQRGRNAGARPRLESP